MLKLTYVISFLAVTSLLSCEKKVTYPSQNNKTTPADTNSGKIYCIAGNGYKALVTGGFSGDGGAATVAELYHPAGVVVDNIGNIYISDLQNGRVRKVNTTGVISTYAGNGVSSYSGDGGPATAAELRYPYGLALDNTGNLYISDNSNNRIRKVDAAGIISTYAGNGVEGYTGDGGSATAAELALPFGLAIDVSDNLYIADYSSSHIRKVNTIGIISTIAGISLAGYAGDGGPATASELDGPQGVAVDGIGNVYIADYINNRIRFINTSGIISTIAGNGFGAPFAGGYSGDGGAATSAELYNPTDVKVDGLGNIYIADDDNIRVRVVNLNGIISTYTGIGDGGYSGNGGPATSAEISSPQGIAVDGSGNLYIADLYNNVVRIVYK
jgi:trimeric autotransporter adhesin